MATSAFKSTTRRTPITQSSSSSSTASADDSSSSARAHRRSRSLSRFSRPLARDEFPDDNVPKGKFVNTVRGSGFPELTLDDLAVQFFNSADRGRSASRRDDVSSSDERVTSATQRRGRSVSRPSSRVSQGKSSVGGNLNGVGRANAESDNSRRRRSVSVVRYQISDSESDLDHTQKTSNRGAGVRNCGSQSQGGISNKAGGLRRSCSQKDLKYHDGYSSHSSALTDDEGRDAHVNRSGVEKTIRAVYAQRKGDHPTGEDVNGGLYAVMRKELRSAVDEIRSELEQSIGKGNGSVSASDDSLLSGRSDVLQAVSTIKRNYATKLEESEKRKQDLLAEILLEEQRGREISKIVKELLPEPENSGVERAPRTRKRSNDRTRMSRRLTEEAEKYIEDFISNVEDTDISSLDGERSDTSSTLGVVAKTEHFQSPAVSRTEVFQTPVMAKSRPVEMDGVVLPWLQWETSNDASPLSCKNKEPTSTPKSNLWDASLERTPVCELSMRSISSHGSWSPGIADVHSINRCDVTSTNLADLGSYDSWLSFSGTRTSRIDVDDYLSRSSDEDLLLERWNQRQKIHSGGLLFCNRMFSS